MKIKKSLLVAGAVTSISLAGVTGLGVASAATNTTANNGESSLIDKIAAKFSLNKNEVKAVFDADHAEHEADQQKKAEEALTQAVKDGKITSAQKDLILAKQKEIKSAMDSDRDAMKDKTGAERKTAMEQKRTELESWAKTNNIPTEYLRYVMGGGRGHGSHGGPGMNGGGEQDQTSSTTSSTTSN